MTGSLQLREYPGGRAGQYRKQNLTERYGADIRLPDLREEIAQCERRGLMHDASQRSSPRRTSPGHQRRG